MAKKIRAVQPDEIEKCNKWNVEIVEEFLQMKSELSPSTIPQYKSALYIWVRWIYDNLKNKPIYKIKSREYALYQNWLNKMGLGEKAIRFKRSAVSSLNEYIMVFYEDKYPSFRNFVNKQIKVPLKGDVHDKVPLTPNEYNKLCKTLAKKEAWQKLAYVIFSYSTGCRREECRQIKKNIVFAPAIIKDKEVIMETGEKKLIEVKFYKTHTVRCKGRGEVGNQRKLLFSQEALDAINKWLEVRGDDDCPYLFVTKNNNRYEQIGVGGFNYWCHGLFSEIIGRRIHPHIFRETRATHLVVNEGKNIDVAKKLLGHKSADTTDLYVIRDDKDDADEAFDI